MTQKKAIVAILSALCFISSNIHAEETTETNNEEVKTSIWSGLKELIATNTVNNEILKEGFSYNLIRNALVVNGSGLHFSQKDVRTSNERTKLKNQMIALAEHISDEHDIEIKKAQKIIDTTFLEAERANIEPILMLSVIGVESKYNQYARSKMGAVGLVQVMPNYHRSKINGLKKDNLDMWSIEGNIKLGVTIMKEYIELANGDIQKALQMYNGSTRDSKLAYSKKVFNQKASLDNALIVAKM